MMSQFPKPYLYNIKDYKMQMSEYDVIFISYDEPEAEENWAHLLSLAPWAQRVHGVKGFDAAHKEAAALATTSRFITVDGDTRVDPKFFDLEINIPEKFEDCVLSWASTNVVNGLAYGNGGLKLWTKDFVNNMQTHEAAKRGSETVDFCWDEKYVQLNGIWSETRPNGSPFQAFRAGFREGIKMTLDRGSKLAPNMLKGSIHPKNLRRLMIWMNVGADTTNGKWCIYGARLGLKLGIIDGEDIDTISDYDWFRELWDQKISKMFYGPDEKCPKTGYATDMLLLSDACNDLGNTITEKTGLPMLDNPFNPKYSSFFKEVYEPAPRTVNPFVTEWEADNGII